MATGLGWNPLYLPPASQEVEKQFSWFVDQATDFTNDARGFVSDLENFTITPVTINEVVFDENLTFTPFVKPLAPEFLPPVISLAGAPLPPAIELPQFSTLNGIRKPNVGVPSAPSVNTVSAPSLDLTSFVGFPPVLDDVGVPIPGEYVLPDLPTIDELNLPEAPDVNLAAFTLERPELQDPSAYLYSNDYVKNAGDARAAIFTQVDASFEAAQTEYNLRNTDGDKALNRLGTMLDGGSGLPAVIEQALFDKGISREEISSQQAVVQSYDEWASRGFSLPGAALLARVSEARQANRDNRGQVNRDITIRFYEQEIENLRFSVQQGIALQGQVFDQYIQMHTSGREIADRSFDVARSIFDARLDMFRINLEIYQADIQAFREKIQIELARLEVFRSQLQAEQVKGEVNEQRVRVYVARIQAVDTQVQVFRSEVEAANAQIAAQSQKIELFNGRVEAYKTKLEGEQIKVDIFDTRVRAEQSRVSVYEAQVRGYTEAVRGYQIEADVEISKIGARNSDNEARTNRYQTDVQAWSLGLSTQIDNLQSLTQVFQAEVGKYNAELGAEGSRLQGEARNQELVLEGERAKLAGRLKVGDQRIEEMRHATSLGLETIRTAATTLSQLAASAMSAITVSAGITNTLSSQTSYSSSYTEDKDLPTST